MQAAGPPRFASVGFDVRIMPRTAGSHRAFLYAMAGSRGLARE